MKQLYFGKIFITKKGEVIFTNLSKEMLSVANKLKGKKKSSGLKGEKNKPNN